MTRTRLESWISHRSLKKGTILLVIAIFAVWSASQYCLIAPSLQEYYRLTRATMMISSRATAQPSGNRSSNTSRSRYAYVFMSFGCDPEDDMNICFAYMAHIMASAKLLKQRFGSQADIVAIFKLRLNSQWEFLPTEQEQMLTKMGVKIKYLPRSSPNNWQESTSFYISTLNKIHILNLTEYERVLYLDSDVLPLTNLDYLFDLSKTIFKPNIIIPTARVPMIAGFFMIRPNQTAFDILIEEIDRRSRIGALDGRGFKKIGHWGHPIEPPDEWLSNSMSGTKFDYYGACTDQGIFYHYPKYMQKSMTQILSRRIINFGPGPNNTVIVEKEWQVNSPHDSPLFNHSANHFTFERPDCRRVTKLQCLPPYSDHAHFMSGHKPWLRPPPQDLFMASEQTSAHHLWWQMIYKLRDEDGIDMISSLKRFVPGMEEVGDLKNESSIR